MPKLDEQMVDLPQGTAATAVDSLVPQEATVDEVRSRWGNWVDDVKRWGRRLGVVALLAGPTAATACGNDDCVEDSRQPAECAINPVDCINISECVDTDDMDSDTGMMDSGETEGGTTGGGPDGDPTGGASTSGGEMTGSDATGGPETGSETSGNETETGCEACEKPVISDFNLSHKGFIGPGQECNVEVNQVGGVKYQFFMSIDGSAPVSCSEELTMELNQSVFHSVDAPQEDGADFEIFVKITSGGGEAVCAGINIPIGELLPDDVPNYDVDCGILEP